MHDGWELVEETMRYLPFGRSGLRVSEIALGCVRMGEGVIGVGEAESRAILHAYLEAGGNFIDTAGIYNGGASEEMLGKLIGGARDQLVIATKFGMGGEKDPIVAAGAARKSMRLSVERSLRRLKTDHVDILYLHQWDFDTAAEEVLQAMGDLVARGLVDQIAVSNAPAWIVARSDAMAELHGWRRFAGMQIPYSLLERSADREILPMARALDMGLCCWGPIAHGALALANISPPAALPVNPNHAAIVTNTAAIARRRGISMAQVALAWLRQQPGGLIAVAGADSVDQLRDNVASTALILTDEELAELNDVSRPSLGYPLEYLHRESFTNMRTAYKPDQLRSG